MSSKIGWKEKYEYKMEPEICAFRNYGILYTPAYTTLGAMSKVHICNCTKPPRPPIQSSRGLLGTIGVASQPNACVCVEADSPSASK